MEKRSMTLAVTLIAVVVLVLGLLGAFALGGNRSAEARGEDPARQVAAAGTGTATGTPDVMRFTVGVDVTRPEVGDAVDASNALMKKVLRAVRSHGVADKDIRTTRYAIEPRYDYSGDSQRLTGYVVTQRARITLRDLDRASAAITGVSTSGGNDVRVEGIAFEVSDPEALLDQARADAVDQARAHAEVYARAAGAELGEVIDIQEATATRGNPQGYAMRDFAELANAPIEPGESELEVRVSVTWSLA